MKIVTYSHQYALFVMVSVYFTTCLAQSTSHCKDKTECSSSSNGYLISILDNLSLKLDSINNKLDALSERADGFDAKIDALSRKVDSSQCTQYTTYTDCSDVWADGKRADGIYIIKPKLSKRPFSVYCELSGNEPWTVFQRRVDGSVDFYRSWENYKNGFGNLSHEFWLGNDNIYAITNQAQYKLALDLYDWNGFPRTEGNHRSPQASLFRIDDESKNYTLHVPSEYAAFTGASGLRAHRGPFVTYDNNPHGTAQSANCAVKYHCGFWFISSCVRNANFNGRYYVNGFINGDRTARKRGDDDMHWPNVNQSLRKTVMKVQRRRPGVVSTTASP